MKKERFQSDRVLAYFRLEWKVLVLITLSGLIYNLGLLAGPWFEGKMTGCLVDILNGNSETAAMLSLVLGYVAAIAIVQVSRYVKRFYVRRFANNVNRRMKQVLYRSLVTKSRASLKEEGEGDVMIVSIWNRKGTIFEGYHTFAVQKVNGELMVYNRFNNSAESTEKKTMGEVIENGQFIVGYRVQNAK